MATTSSTKNNIQTTTSFSDLPADFAFEIFSRLPAKSLILASSVSRTWYSHIVNPNFISAQVRRYLSCCDNNSVLIIPPNIREQPHAFLISAQTASVIESFRLPFSTASETLKVIGSINGLLLLTDLHLQYSCRLLFLWNPSVRTFRRLFSTFNKLINNPQANYCNAGLGFCKSDSDYRVVRIIYNVDSQSRPLGDVAPQAEIYSLKRRTWRTMRNPVVPRFALANGTYVNASYYWLAHDQQNLGTQDVDELWMLSFDFDNEVFGELKFSDEVCNCVTKIGQCQLMVFEGSLCLCVFGPEQNNTEIRYPYYIWVMRKEDDGIFWDLHFKVELEKSGWPMNITRSGTLLIESCPLPSQRLDITSIFSRDLKSNHYKDLGFGKRGGVKDDSMYLVGPATVDTSFVKSMVMYEGGNSLMRYAR